LIPSEDGETLRCSKPEKEDLLLTATSSLPGTVDLSISPHAKEKLMNRKNCVTTQYKQLSVTVLQHSFFGFYFPDLVLSPSVVRRQ